MNIISYAGDMLIQDELLLVSAQYEDVEIILY
jgi:hypothetical protein